MRLRVRQTAVHGEDFDTGVDHSNFNCQDPSNWIETGENIDKYGFKIPGETNQEEDSSKEICNVITSPAPNGPEDKEKTHDSGTELTINQASNAEVISCASRCGQEG